MSTTSGCCKDTSIVTSIHRVSKDEHEYTVTIVNCKNCGSLKSSSGIRHEK